MSCLFPNISCLIYHTPMFIRAGYSGIQRRDPPWVIFSTWDYNCMNSTDTSAACIRTEISVIGPNVSTDMFTSEGDGQQTYMVLPWTANRTHAFLLSASRRVPTPDGRDCELTAYYRSEAQPLGGIVDPWAKLATMRFGCSQHPLSGAYSFVEDFTANGRQRAAGFGPALFKEPGSGWVYGLPATFSDEWWWTECYAQPTCLRRRDGLWESTPSSAATRVPRFKLVTGSVPLPCPTASTWQVLHQTSQFRSRNWHHGAGNRP